MIICSEETGKNKEGFGEISVKAFLRIHKFSFFFFILFTNMRLFDKIIVEKTYKGDYYGKICNEKDTDRRI